MRDPNCGVAPSVGQARISWEDKHDLFGWLNNVKLQSDSSTSTIETSILVVHRPETCDWHSHDGPELLWHVEGSFRVELPERSWLVAPGTGVWIPRGITHRMTSDSSFAGGWAVFPDDLCPPLWNQPASISATPLLVNLLSHLATNLGLAERSRAQDVAIDVLHEAMSTASIELPIPRDERCRTVAESILANPARDWELSDWAAEVGIGTRTLARLFQSETAMTFGQWRTHARMRVAIGELAAGQSADSIARRIGYSTTNAFIAAFQRATGRPPSSYRTTARHNFVPKPSQGFATKPRNQHCFHKLASRRHFNMAIWPFRVAICHPGSRATFRVWI